MKFISTRYIVGNRGDLLSRYGILSALEDIGFENSITVFAAKEEHIKPLKFRTHKYGLLYNTIPDLEGWKSLFKADAVIWTGGLDLSDHSSVLKLFYILVNFFVYRILKLKIYVLNQGAGPVQTKLGKILIKRILGCVNILIARDRDSLIILKSISPKTHLILSFDGIFAGKLQTKKPDSELMCQIFNGSGNQPVIGFNIREWFFFKSNFFPINIKFGKKYPEHNKAMQQFINAAITAILGIQSKFNCKIVLISAYEPDSSPIFDDLPILAELKRAFQTDKNVILVDNALELPEYLYLISKLDLVIGTRLHTTLTALRLNVPAINISYTLKGKSILTDMELPELIIDINDFVENPYLIVEKMGFLLDNKQIKERIRISVERAIHGNYMVFRELFLARAQILTPGG